MWYKYASRQQVKLLTLQNCMLGAPKLGVGKDTKRRYFQARQFVALEVARSSKHIQARQLLPAVAANMRSQSLSDVLGALFLLSSGCQAGIPMQRWAKY